MLVVTEAGAERTGRLLVDELDLLGLTSELRAGRQEVAETAHQRSEHRAVVWVHDDHQTRIWLQGEGAESPHDVTPSESRELSALRTAEALRGRLLPGQESPPPWDERALPDPEGPHRFELFGGPGLIISSYAEPLPAFSMGFAYRLHPRVSVGVFALGSLTRNAWQGDPEQLSTSEFAIGGRLGFRWLDRPGTRIRSDLLLRGAFRGLSVRDEGGPMEKGSATLWGPTIDLGMDATYEFTPWFGLGVESCLIVGFPLARSAGLDNGMEPGPASPIIAATENVGVDVQVATSFLAVASW